jgi:pimeloyl-ACP methyl ester carboxylesterase
LDVRTEYMEAQEGSLAYTDYGGTGELVLMLPGMGALSTEYRFLAPALRGAGYRAVAADLRGHGESSVPWPRYDVPSAGSDILALVAHLTGGEGGDGGSGGGAHLVGTSFAASPVVWAAVERPELVRSLVLISPFVRDARINPVMKALFWLMMHNPWRVRLWGAYYRTLYPTRKPDDFDDYLKQLLANMAEPGRMNAANALANSSRRPSAERLRRVREPTLVIMGTKDPDFPDPASEGRTVARETGGSLVLIEGAGHYPQTEMPEKTVPVVTNFLKDVAGRAQRSRLRGEEQEGQ